MKQILLAAIMGMLLNSAAYATEKPVQLAAFDHSRLTASSNCIRCHRRDQPDDDRHRQTQANCSTCHNTGSWKPATLGSDSPAK